MALRRLKAKARMPDENYVIPATVNGGFPLPAQAGPSAWLKPPMRAALPAPA